MKKIVLLLLFALLGGCGTVHYVPEHYVIDQGRIPKFDLKGNVTVVNAQSDQSKQVFFNSSMDWVGDYKTITEHLVTQLRQEIAKNAKNVGSGESKTLSVKVDSLHAAHHLFTFSATMREEVSMGDGEQTQINVRNSSPGTMWRTLNGAIALGVIDILKDPKVIKYLSQ